MLALVQVVYGIQISTSGGGIAGGSGFVATQIDASKDASVQGPVTITGADIKPFTVISGPIKTFSQTHQVTDKSGKSAKVTASVTNAPDGLDYASEVKPAEGTLATIETLISAQQWLTVPKADSIKCSAIATYKTLSADTSIIEVKGSAKGDNVTLIEYG